MDLYETSYPHTPYGQEHGEFAKMLTDVDDKAKNTYGFHGDWITRGAPGVAAIGSIVLECCGYRTRRDEEAKRRRLFVLWRYEEDGWVEIARSDARDWALKLRKIAKRELECND